MYFPKGSNGWADVRDKNDFNVCTCYVNGRASAEFIIEVVNAFSKKKRAAV